MSSTGRQKKTALPGLDTIVGRHSEDFYRTPADATDAILPHLREPEVWVDAGCGDAAIASRVLARWPGSNGFGVEISLERAEKARLCGFTVVSGDFLISPTPHDRIDLVIGNPPYGIALEFARRAIEITTPIGGEVALLLRMGFLEAERDSPRDLFLEEHRPDVYQLAKRPRFRGPGDGGDSATYGWLVWGPGRGERYVRLRPPGRVKAVDTQLQLIE